ncbi:transmembrane protein, putative [Medicago truncatula]|uniref:Transmembrane protein, putative n=1 Tax=Medicago truncatula TaxID=3880 RepID=A0A072TJL9_MEDTR|nr:transmembrane protein, putative [Medicago truncatula]
MLDKNNNTVAVTGEESIHNDQETIATPDDETPRGFISICVAAHLKQAKIVSVESELLIAKTCEVLYMFTVCFAGWYVSVLSSQIPPPGQFGSATVKKLFA